jgi:primosomal protein N' (replication factor Y)
MTQAILEIALATPLRRLFDYLPPQGIDATALQVGARLVVPFGRREVVGLLLATKTHSDVEPGNLKRATAVLDTAPVLSAAMIELCRWSASYYLHPLGDALFHALPPPLRKERPNTINSARGWRLNQHGKGLNAQAFARAPRQQQALEHLLEHQAVLQTELEHCGVSREALQALVVKGLVEAAEISPEAPPLTIGAGPALNPEQRSAVDAIAAGLGTFHPCLLEGVTGSGKTEVYLNAIEAALQQGQQALVLVPEIGLTPQTIARFEQRFPRQVVALHSGLSDGERLYAWQASGLGLARVVIGTRSAILTAFQSLGLIVIDEEHDTSYKQQEGFRYSARDVAVKRAQLANIPIVLGSATPSAESLHNALQGRYHSLLLQERAGDAQPPTYQLLDLRDQQLQDGFSAELLQAIEQTIGQGNQVLVFLNRRGFAPALICHACGWVADCPHCDVRMVVHRRLRLLKCHHCETQAPLPVHCPACSSPQLLGVGLGTERSEAFLQARFTSTPVLRIDRDTTRHKGAMDKFLQRINSGEPAILVGTQMLAKGHHFPRVTLVAVLDADAGLCSSDFRGPERTAQMLLQVAGRSGRAERPGRVIIQTHYPEHPLLLLLVQDRYRQLSEQILGERLVLQLPPFGFLGIVRCDASRPDTAEQLLLRLRDLLAEYGTAALIGPLAPPVARRAGRYRSQLLLKSAQRGPLHHSLQMAVNWLQEHGKVHGLRWSVDVDPQDFI